MNAVQMAIHTEASVSIAHELNQPLNAAMNCADAALRWLQRAIPDIDEAAAAVEASINAIRRASDVVRSVHRLLNHVNPERSDVAIDRIVLETLQMMAFDASSADVVVRADLRCPGVRISADPTLLQQVLINLVTNALQSLRAVADRARIVEVATQVDERSVVVAVRDNGCGFSPDAKLRAFEPFYSTKRDGMGIGLAMCRSIAAIHGGEIVLAEARQGSGAQVEVRLPIPTPCSPARDPRFVMQSG